MRANPTDGAALRRENPSYVFFREITGDGPIGSQQVVLTAGRSLAVDRRFVALGVPIWLDTRLVSLVTDSCALINNTAPGHDNDTIWMANTNKLPPPSVLVEVTIKLKD